VIGSPIAFAAAAVDRLAIVPNAASRLAAVAVHLPETTRSTPETERELRERNRRVRPATGLIRRMTGVERVHVRPAGAQASDLAVAAARDALAQSPGPIDLVVFASATQDLIEPATSHIVSAKLGLDAPVMDVKNACNSMLNGIQVADALIRAGQYRRVLVASGEQPSHAVRWDLRGREDYLRGFPGYTMSDGGAAVIVEATSDPDRRILASRFHAVSRHWQVGTLPTGGTMNPHDDAYAYFDMDGSALQRAFLDLGPQPVFDFLDEAGITWDDVAFVGIHQVSLPFLPPIMARLGVPEDRTVVTIADHGNLASVSLPLQLVRARERGVLADGDLAVLIGLAGGISLGLMAVRV